MEHDEFTPGKLCTVLHGKRAKLPAMVQGDVIAVPVHAPEHYAMFRGWPLQVLWHEPGTPFVVFQVLRDVGAGEHLPPKVMLDLRRATFSPVSREYVRTMLGQPYKTTL